MDFFLVVFFIGLTPLVPVFATSILRIYRNDNTQYNIINSVLPVVILLRTCFIVLRKVPSITLGVFMGQKSSGSISSSAASRKISGWDSKPYTPDTWGGRQVSLAVIAS